MAAMAGQTRLYAALHPYVKSFVPCGLSHKQAAKDPVVFDVALRVDRRLPCSCMGGEMRCLVTWSLVFSLALCGCNSNSGETDVGDDDDDSTGDLLECPTDLDAEWRRVVKYAMDFPILRTDLNWIELVIRAEGLDEEMGLGFGREDENSPYAVGLNGIYTGTEDDLEVTFTFKEDGDTIGTPSCTLAAVDALTTRLFCKSDRICMDDPKVSVEILAEPDAVDQVTPTSDTLSDFYVWDFEPPEIDTNNIYFRGSVQFNVDTGCDVEGSSHQVDFSFDGGSVSCPFSCEVCD
jgi:hypothetical protein